MRGHRAGRGAAALFALAVFACVLGWGCMRAAAKTPLEIEVIASAAELRVEPEQERPRVLIYHTHTWEAYEMEPGAEYTPTEKWRTKDES